VANGCEIIVLLLIDVRKKSVFTHSVPLGDLWTAGCWDCMGVDVIAAGFVFNWCFCGVGWMSESFVWMFVMVQPSQQRLDQGICESPLDNMLIVLGVGREFPFICLFKMCRRSFSGGLFSTRPSQHWLDQLTAGSTGQQCWWCWGDNFL